jgi:penicillin-binding protein 2
MNTQTPLNPLLDREEKLSPGKLHAAQYIVALVLVVLIAGLWRLQVLDSDNYRSLAQANRIRKVPILAPRGRIFDREGRLIVDNYPSVTCFLLREQLRPGDLDLIARGLSLSVDQINAAIRHYAGSPGYQPIPLKQDISPDEQAFIEAHRNELPELETLDEQRRAYPQEGFAAHMLGYVGEVSEKMLENDSRYAFYEPGDVVGRSGIEETYDSFLRGVNGSRDIVVNSHGKEVGQLGETYAQPGHDLKLTIDLDVQRAAEQALDGKNGAIVALDPHTGEILAMVSRPTFDPNQFLRLTQSYWKTILDNPDHPLLNKAIQAQLAPGSTFKIIMSVAGLEEGVAQDMRVNCAGGATFYGHFYACDAHHGGVDIHNAIPYSCDTFYYTLANRLGIDVIARYAHSVGIGEKTGVDLPDEAAGTMPSTAWKLKTQHAKWFAGETISVGIGQGAVTVTPLQLARALGGIASGGVMHRPHLVFPSEVPADLEQSVQESFPGSGEKTIPLSPANWQIITDGMAAVTGVSGTAAAAHLEGIDFAGKTGTAQVIGHEALAHTGKGHSTVPNAWFVGMAPRRNPDIVVAVIFEHGEWGKYAAKLAAQVIETYVDKQREREHNVRMVEVAAPVKQPSDSTDPAAGAPTPEQRTPETPKAAPIAVRKTAPATDPGN